MRHLLSMAACLAMVMTLPASAQERETQRRDQEQTRNQQQQGQQQQGQQQTIRGTVAGVTSIGEAVIDPQTGTAAAVQVNYLTVLGSPMRGQRGAGSEATPGTQQNQNEQRNQAQRNQSDQNRQANQGRQNLYLIAISPQTQVREGGQQGNRTSPAENRTQPESRTAPAGDRKQAQSAFEKLEIGDRVQVQFKTTGRLQAQAQGKSDKDQKTAQDDKDSKESQERVAGFRGDSKNKHGRNRIYIGEASTITIMSNAGQQRGQGSQRGQDRERQQNESN